MTALFLGAELFAKLSSGQDVEVEVPDGLAGVLAAVVDDAEAGSQILPQLRDDLKTLGDIGGILRRDVRSAGDMELWHHKEMDRGLGVQVVEGDDIIVLVPFRRRDFPGDDFTSSRTYYNLLISVPAFP